MAGFAATALTGHPDIRLFELLVFDGLIDGGVIHDAPLALILEVQRRADELEERNVLWTFVAESLDSFGCGVLPRHHQILERLSQKLPQEPPPPHEVVVQKDKVEARRDGWQNFSEK